MCIHSRSETAEPSSEKTFGNSPNTASVHSIVIDAPLARSCADSLFETAAEAIKVLRLRGESVALAESCTGGLLAAALASVPGASDVLNSSAVVYQTRAKSSLLGLDAGFVDRFCPVSPEVTAALAKAAREKNGVELGAAVTGWAGPSGGTAADPVGTCYIAVSRVQGTTCFRLAIEGDRNQVRNAAACTALKIISGNIQPEALSAQVNLLSR